MSRKESPQSVIDSYRRRQQMAPYFLMGLALLLVVIGIVILVMWFSGENKSKVGSMSLFATPTATVTSSSTPTLVPPTGTATSTATITVSPTLAFTSTPSGPFEYTVEDGDNCWDIAVKNKVSLEVLQAINSFGSGCPIKAGDKILIPLPGAELPTPTPFPADFKGKVNITVMTGDTVASIAAAANSTVDAIVTENKITDLNSIKAGDILIVPVNIVTVTPTKVVTVTSTAGGPTNTPVPPTATTKP